eukprot:scaffold145_cov195-Alexandrium_tamarense.AAC.75
MTSAEAIGVRDSVKSPGQRRVVDTCNKRSALNVDRQIGGISYLPIGSFQFAWVSTLFVGCNAALTLRL